MEEKQLNLNKTVEGKVIAIDRAVIYVDLAPYGTGIVYGKEYLSARDILKKTRIGNTITAKIIALETESGYVDLSLKEERRAHILNEAEHAMKNKTVFEVTAKSANRGGLIIEWNGLRGFLPASHLDESHYPKVINGNKEEILNELNKLIGEKLSVTIESIDETTDNLIFKEFVDKNDPSKKEEKKMIEDMYQVGDIKQGIVTGIVDFGLFIKIDENVEGLVHISEIDWGLVDDLRKMYSIGDSVNVKITEVKNGKYSFSIKELKENPWEKVAEKHKIGDIVSGVVIKYNQHGAFASIEAGVTGLIHISSFKSEEDLRDKLGIGKVYKFKILNFEPKDQKLTLALNK